MAKEEIKEAAVEEPEVKTKATEETIEDTTTTDETTNDGDEKLSPWYYFFSQGCGWCKKATPIVEELIKDGHDILMLDLAESDNAKLNQELKDEYNVQCGTPWFINADTSQSICGFREKDVLEKWLAGEEIPTPPRPSGPPPRLPMHDATKEEENTWKKEYKTWLKDNEHMPDEWMKRQKSADEIIDQPRPKTPPPVPPGAGRAPGSAEPSIPLTEEAIDKWGEELVKWQKENKHLPNLTPVDKIVTAYKQRLKSPENEPNNRGAIAAAAAPVDNAKLNSLEAKMTALEVKIDKVMNHFGVK